MKWLAFLLLLVNFATWYFAGALQAPLTSSAGAAGNLPRVASLKSGERAEVSPLSELPDTASPVAESPSMGNESSEPVDPEVAVTESDDQQEADPVAANPIPVPPLCVRMGWLETIEAAQALVAGQSVAEEVGVIVEEVEQELPPYHWVIIPPQPRAVALKQFRDIQRQGIDSYLVTEGENRNAISLGLFESREAAISVLEEKKRQNFNAVLANFPRNQISYALVFEAEPELAEALVEAVKTDYGSKFDFIEINPCEGVATPPKNP